MKRITKLFKKDFFWLVVLVIIFIALRSVNFVYYLTFIGWDQAEHAIEALNVFRQRKLVLIGPPVTAVSYQGRQIFLGPLMTYLMIFFLFLGNWNPITASYIFMVFCGLMVIPLYFSIKWLIGRRSAWLIVIIYSFLPYYLTYTRFLWNPNFQFALLPILFLFMGGYRKTKNTWYLFLTSFWLGLLLQLHYQFVISIFLITVYYFFLKKEGIKKSLIYLAGFLIGFSPILIFELRHQFYLSKTLLLFLQYFHQLDIRGNRNHYYLSLSFTLLVVFLWLINRYLKRLNKKIFRYLVISLLFILFIFSLKIIFIQPKSAFWSAAPNWNYLTDIRAYQIIKDEQLTDFNVTNQVTDSLALNQKYLLMRDNIKTNYEDYWHNRYLFVIEKAGKQDFMDNPGYEVHTFRPYKLVKNWNLNDYYVMYLVERLINK